MRPSSSEHLEKDVEEQQNLLSSRSSEDIVFLPRKEPGRRYSILLALTTLLVGVAIGSLLGFRISPVSDSRCTKQLAGYSVVTEDVDIKYDYLRFNGSFMKANIYRQSASPEVDAAWKALGVDYRAVAVPEEHALQAGIRPEQVKIKQKYGGGYPANVEGLHQLHCLNLLRKALYYNYDYYHERKEGAFMNDDSIVQLHVSHCLDIIRQQLMCTTDLGVLGQVWWDKKEPTTFVDFNTQHKCKNFDAVRQWAEVRQLPEDPPEDFLEPPISEDAIYAEIP